MIVEIKLNDGAVMPEYAHEWDAGLDLRATEDAELRPGEWKMVGSGVSVAIPKGFVGIVVPRSGLGCKGLVLKNTVGIIDSGYRGEIGLTLYNNNPTHVYFPSDDTMGGGGECYEENFDGTIHVNKGDRVAQLLIMPVTKAQLVQVESLGMTERQDGGFGSSGTE